MRNDINFICIRKDISTALISIAGGRECEPKFVANAIGGTFSLVGTSLVHMYVWTYVSRAAGLFVLPRLQRQLAPRQRYFDNNVAWTRDQSDRRTRNLCKIRTVSSKLAEMPVCFVTAASYAMTKQQLNVMVIAECKIFPIVR